MKKPRITIGPDAVVRLDHNRHVGVEFYRDEDEVRYLAYTPHGLEIFSMPPAEYDRAFRQRLLQPIGSVALDLLSASHRYAYAPGKGVLETLMEIYTMATTNGSADLTALDMKGLTDHYNGLAKALGRGPVKGFKSKAEALKRIEAVSAEASKPSEAQSERAAEIEKAAKPAAKKAEKKADKPAPAAKKAEKPAETSRAMKAAAEALSKPDPKAAKKADKAARFPSAAKKADKPKDAKPRGQGIGAYCMELIKKGKTNEQVLAAVREKFPGASTSPASVAWYRNKLKDE